MPPTLEHCFTLRGYFEKENSLDLKTVLGGPQRILVPITSGFIRGKGLDAELLSGGADSLLMNPETNTAHLNVRLNVRTKNGHAIYIHYDVGVLQVDEKSAGPLSYAEDAKGTQFGDHEWFASPVMETSDPEFKWVERSVFIGEGRWVVEQGNIGIEYEIYRLRPSR